MTYPGILVTEGVWKSFCMHLSACSVVCCPFCRIQYKYFFQCFWKLISCWFFSPSPTSGPRWGWSVKTTLAQRRVSGILRPFIPACIGVCFRGLQFSLSKNSIYDVFNEIINWPNLPEGQAAAVFQSFLKQLEVGCAAFPDLWLRTRL